MHRRTLDIHQEEANIENLFLAPLDDPRFADLPENAPGLGLFRSATPLTRS